MKYQQGRPGARAAVMKAEIAPARFRLALLDVLRTIGKAPVSLDVQRIDHALVAIRWQPVTGAADALSLREAQVIDGGPEWVARLITAKRRQRRELLLA